MADDPTTSFPPTLEQRWEAARQSAFRKFRVWFSTGMQNDIEAHFWDCDNPGGHLTFYTIEPSGRRVIRRAISGRQWAELLEITEHPADEYFALMSMLEAQIQASRLKPETIH